MGRRRNQASAPISLFSFQDLITSLSGILILLVLLMAIEIAAGKLDESQTDSKAESMSGSLRDLRASVASLSSDVADLKVKVGAGVTLSAVEVVSQLTKAERENAELAAALSRLQAENAVLGRESKSTRTNVESSSPDLIALESRVEALRESVARAEADKKTFYIPEEGSAKSPVIVECSATKIRVGYIGRPELPIEFASDDAGISAFDKHLRRYSTDKEYLVFMIKPSGVRIFYSLTVAARDRGFEIGYDALEEDRSVALGPDST